MRERPDTVAYTTFSRRLLAAAIDLFILFVISMLLSPLIMYFVYGNYTPELLMQDMQSHATPDNKIDIIVLLNILIENKIFARMVFMQFLMFVMMASYSLFFWTKYSATPGKWIVGCKIVDSNYNDITLKIGIIRIFGYILSSMTIFIGFIMPEFTKKRQALHDMVAKTYVIDAKPDFSRFSTLMKKFDKKIS